MAQDLNESSTFETTVPSLTTADDVKGSVDPGDPNLGEANGPHVKVTNRTKWLNDNKVNLAGGVMTGKLDLLQSTHKYITGSEFTTKNKVGMASGHLRLAAGLPAATQKKIITFPTAGADGMCWLKIAISRALSTMVVINVPVALPISATKNFIIGQDIGDSFGLANIALNAFGQQINPALSTAKAAFPGLHLYTNSTATGDSNDNQFDGTDAYLKNGLIIIEKDQITIRNPHTADALPNFYVLFEILGLNI